MLLSLRHAYPSEIEGETEPMPRRHHAMTCRTNSNPPSRARLARSRDRDRICFEPLEVRLFLSGHGPEEDHDDSGYPIFDPVLHQLYYTPDTSPQTADSPTSLAPPGGDANRFPLDQTFLLHSLPGANRIIYLDFDGHITTGTRWNTQYGDPLVHEPYDTDGDTDNFSDDELTDIQLVWQRMVEDFLPFNINVTTQDPGVEALRKSGLNDTVWGTRVVFCLDDFGVGAGGVAFLNSFADSQDDPAFAFIDSVGYNPKNMAEVASHETGHALGLGHDGINNPPTEVEPDYYDGHGTGQTSWAPIMGVGYSANVTQWSKGQYAGANNLQDDLATIASVSNGVAYKQDDHPSTNEEALGDEPNFLRLAPGGASVEDEGIIEQNTDVDAFVFSLDEEGAIDLEIKPFYLGPNLDIKVSIYRQADNEGDPDVLVLEEDPTNRLDVVFDRVILPGGTYFLHIEGTGFGNPDATTRANRSGYTDYGSLGYYSIIGEIDLKTPRPTAVDLLPESDTGVSTTDDITRLDNSSTGPGPNDKRLRFRITGTLPGATVRLYAQPADDPAAVPVEIGSIVASSSTAVVTTRGTVDLLDGQHLITARQKLTDLPQSRGTDPLTITVDTVAPTVPGLPDLDAMSDSGVSNSDDVTNIARPRFVAAAAHAADDLLEFHVNGALQSIAASSDGGGGLRLYGFVPGVALPDGPHTVTVRATDVAGNVSNFSGALGVLIDTVGPLADVEDITPDPRNTRVDQARIVFDDAVFGLDLSGVTLRRNNGSNLLTGAQTLTSFDSVTWVLDNLQPLTQQSGGYAVAVLAPSLVTDRAGNRLLTQAADTFTIDLPRLSISDVTQLESNGTFRFTLSLSSAINEEVTVNYSIGGGNATAGQDYANQNLTGTVTFSTLATSRTITVDVLDDGVVEEDELFFVTLSGNSPSVSLFKPMGIGTVLNDDLPLVTLSVPDPLAHENGLDPGIFTVTRNGPTSRALTVQYRVGGTATPGSDYQTLSGSVVIPLGHASANITVRPIDDDEFELGETVTLDLLEVVDSYLTAQTGPLGVTVLDNDLPRINIVALDPSAAERGQDPALFRFTRSGHTTDPLTVLYTVGGTATPGVDYAAVPSQITFPAGQSVMTVTAVPFDDFQMELDETVVLTLLEDAAYWMGLNTAAVAVIDNRELPTVELGVSPSAAPIAFEQNTRAADFLLRRTSPLDEPLTVFYTVTGTATNGVDYVALPLSVTLSPGQSTAVLRIQPVDDSPFELDEFVTLTLAPHASYLTGSTVTGTVTIVDNDGGFTEFGGPDRKKAKLTYIDADGDKVTVSLKGPGRGLLYRAFGPGDAARIELFGTSGSASSLTIKGGPTTVRQIDIQGSLRQLSGKAVDVLEEITSLGPITKINLRAAGGELRMGRLGATGREAVSFAVAFAHNLSVLSDVAFASIKASGWTSTNPAATLLDAPSIGRLSVRGDFTSSLNLSGAASGGPTLGKTAIGGLVGSRTGQVANWSITGDAPSILAGAVQNLDIDVLGEFNGITVR